MEFSFEKLEENHISLLLAWLEKPHVKEWWPTPKKDETIQKFLQRIRSKDTFGYVVKVDGKPIGYIQYYYIDRTSEKTGSGLPGVAVGGDWLPDLPETTIGTDQFIGDPDYLHKGYGTRFIKEFLIYLHTIEPDITTVIVDPDPTNIAAIRCYEKVGFERVEVYTAPWGPALLMRYKLA